MRQRLLAALPVPSIILTSGEGEIPELHLGTGVPHVLYAVRELEKKNTMSRLQKLEVDLCLLWNWDNKWECPVNFVQGLPARDRIYSDAFGYTCGDHGVVSFNVWATAAHEFGHTLGLPHTTNGTLSQDRQYELGPCGAKSAPGGPIFPFLFDIAGIQRPTLGPMDGSVDQKVYGWNSYDFTRGDGSRPLDGAPGVIDPTEHFELMSYCKSPGHMAIELHIWLGT